MPKNESVELTDEQLGRLVRRLLGPPEEWDEDAAEFVLRVYGVNPDTTAQYVSELLEIIRDQGEKGYPLSQRLHNWLETLSWQSSAQ